MEKHLKLLAILYIVYGALHVLAAAVGWVVIRWSGLIHPIVSGKMVGLFLLANSVAAVLLIIVTVASAASIIGGIGLMNRKRWARLLLLVLSFLNLIHFPLGTALGAYGIWVLMKDETDSLFPQDSGPVVQQQGDAGR